MSEPRPKRMLRVSKACDYCHRRRIKCRVSQADPHRCQNCVDFSLECESSRPLKRGKAAAANRPGCLAHVANPASTPQTTPAAQPARYGMVPVMAPRQPLPQPPPSSGAVMQFNGGERKGEDLSPAWRAFACASVSLVKQLLGVYFETVYPIFPLFDRDNLDRRLSRDEQLHSRGFFCSVMAACALAAARVRDGAIAVPGSHSQDLSAVPPETFFAAAQDTLPADLLQTQDFDCLRACALLSIASVQDGKIDAMRMYIGHYFTMTATWQWHDEANWPRGLLPVDLEERRRLYWSIYTLDIFTSTVWDGCAHFQEAHARVEYPNGSPGSPATGHSGWLTGWNFTTDLYRILEHALSRLRARPSRFNLFLDSTSGDTAATTQRIVDHINHLYNGLPPTFKELRPATGALEQDIFGFQAANIQATLALLRMALLSLEANPDLDKKCSVASEVLAIFHHVPRAYQRAISTPLIYHIGGIGNILGSVMGAPLSESSYQRVRTLLLSMADLLESLESSLHQRAGAGRRLREQVERIEEYMNSRRQMMVGQQAAAMPAGGIEDVMPASAEGAGAGINGVSPLFQIPDELLQHWDWSFSAYGNQSQFPYFVEAG